MTKQRKVTMSRQEKVIGTMQSRETSKNLKSDLDYGVFVVKNHDPIDYIASLSCSFPDTCSSIRYSRWWLSSSWVGWEICVNTWGWENKKGVHTKGHCHSSVVIWRQISESEKKQKHSYSFLWKLLLCHIMICLFLDTIYLQQSSISKFIFHFFPL